MYSLTPEQLKNVTDVLNKELSDENAEVIVDHEAAAAFLAMSSALARHLLKENRSLKNKVSTQERKIERMSEKLQHNKREIIENEWFGTTELDTPLVARAFLYCLQEFRFYLTKDKFWSLLYLAYCSYLFHFEKTMCLEHPTAIKEGPRFWTVKNINVESYQDRSAWTELTKHNPALANFLKEYARKHGNASEKDLNSAILRSEPFRNAMNKATLSNKKAALISDKDIYLWKEAQGNKK